MLFTKWIDCHACSAHACLAMKKQIRKLSSAGSRSWPVMAHGQPYADVYMLLTNIGYEGVYDKYDKYESYDKYDVPHGKRGEWGTVTCAAMSNMHRAACTHMSRYL